MSAPLSRNLLHTLTQVLRADATAASSAVFQALAAQGILLDGYFGVTRKLLDLL